MNTISVVTLPDRTPIEMREMEISLDIDSFSWALTGELWGAASLAMVEPDQNGVKQVEVNINGWTWILYHRAIHQPSPVWTRAIQHLRQQSYPVTGSTLCAPSQ